MATKHRQQNKKGPHGGMLLVLTEDVPHLGKQGEVVEVKPGYGRNYLVPRGLATVPSEHNLRLLDRYKVRVQQAREARMADLKVLASGKRQGLTAGQQQILDLWGAGVSNERLAEAAGNIRWQLGQSDRYQEGLYRSGAYLPHIRAVARSMGMPEELASLPHVESSFHPGAFSSVAASGMFQFMRETGQRFALNNAARGS